MKHVMIDLETLGTAVNAPVVAIGAVEFNPETGELGKQFYGRIDLEDALRFGRMSGATLKWWLSQSDAARKELASGKHSALLVAEKFVAYMEGIGKNVEPWGNGASFDISILEVWIPRVLNRGGPWEFWNVRDCRTIKAVVNGLVTFEAALEGTAHKALDDAIYQAKWVSHFWSTIRAALKTAGSLGGRMPPNETPMSDLDDLL